MRDVVCECASEGKGGRAEKPACGDRMGQDEAAMAAAATNIMPRNMKSPSRLRLGCAFPPICK